MNKSERTFSLKEGLRALIRAIKGDPLRHEPQHVDPALVTFARLGLLAYYR